MPLVEMGNGQGREKVAFYTIAQYISAYYLNFIHLVINPVDNNENIKTTWNVSHSDNGWPSATLDGEILKLKVNGGTSSGPSSVQITASASGRLIGTFRDGYGGAAHNIDDYINAGETKTYSGLGGVSNIYATFI